MMIASAVSKLLDAKDAVRDPKLAFLKSYEYDLGTEELVPKGVQECVAFTRHVFCG